MMLIEHEDLRNTNKEFQIAVDEYLGDSDSTEIKRMIQEYGSHFIGVLRQHIDKEDNILFMMDDVHLDQTQIDKVVKLFHEIEIDEEKGGNPGWRPSLAQRIRMSLDSVLRTLGQKLCASSIASQTFFISDCKSSANMAQN